MTSAKRFGLLFTIVFVALVGCGKKIAPLEVEEDIHYEIYDQTFPAVENSDNIELIYFFAYYCSHCDHFEPDFQAWLKKLPKGVDLTLIPVAYDKPAWFEISKYYYALKHMNVIERVHPDIFHTIHDESIDLVENKEKREAFLKKHKIDIDQFNALINDSTILNKAFRAKRLVYDHDIQTTPTLVVAGKYKTYGELTGSNVNTLTVLEHLIEKAKSETKESDQ